MKYSRKDFPADFIFGTATSAYQIEGAAAADGRMPSIWDNFTHTPGKIEDGSNGDAACDHYHRYESDLDLIKNTGFTAYRFSTSWPRVFPDARGTVNPKGVDFYSRLIDGMLERGIEPWITLYHWDLPMYLEENGGWLSRDTAGAFADYADFMVKTFGGRVKNWLTHNEMWCSSMLSYHIGMFAPGVQDLGKALSAAHHILLSHGLAAEAMRAADSSVNVGIAPNYLPSYPATEAESDIKAASIYDGYFNRWFLDPLTGRGYPEDMIELYGSRMPDVRNGDMEKIAAPIDMIGVNYYNSNWYVWDDSLPDLPCRKKQPDGLWFTADRDVYPRGLYDTLRRLADDYGFRRIYITENGAAVDDKLETDSDGRKAVHDADRIRFLQEHIDQTAEAVKDGVPLEGYFIWSLMDNFEWAAGYTLRYGIHYTDFETQERIPKDSALWLRDFLRIS